MSWLRISLGRLRDDRMPTAALALLILVTALVATFAPRVEASLADGAIQAELGRARASDRNLELIRQELIAAGPKDDPLAQVHAAGAELDRTIPSRVRRLVVDRGVVVESARYELQHPTTDPAFIRFRIQDGAADRVRYAEGRPPTALVEFRDEVGSALEDRVPVYEVGVSTRTADAFDLDVGSTVLLVADETDQLVGRLPKETYAFMTVVGRYDVADPDSDYWLDDALPDHPVVRSLSSEVQYLDADVLLDPGAYPVIASTTRGQHLPLRYRWQSWLDTEQITDRRLDDLLADLRRLEVRYPSANVTPTSGTAMRTGLLPILETHRARWIAAEGVLAVIALGPALVAAGTLVLIALLASRRRRSTMTLARARGASGPQVLGSVLVEALLIAVPGAAAATLAAVLAVDAGRLSVTLAAAALVVAIATIVVLATVVPIVRGRLLEARPDTSAVGRSGSRRLVLEGLVVALAAGGAYLLHERGLQPSSSAGDIDRFDPLIAAVPALVGLAAGIVAVRLYPIPLRVVARVARRGRGLVAVLSVRRATEGGSATAILLVLLATASVGAFAAAALDHLERGTDLAAWQEVGGPLRIETGGSLPTQLEPASLPGVQAAAGTYEVLALLGPGGPRVVYQAIDAGALEAILRDTPVDPALPPGFATPADGAVPAIVSRSLVEGDRGLAPDEPFTMNVEGFRLEYRVAAVRDAFPGIPLGRQFVVVARDAFLAQAPTAVLAPTFAILDAPAATADGIRAAIAGRVGSVEVRSQAQAAAELRELPVSRAVRAGILAATLVTAAYAVLGVAAALALAGLARAVEAARLRTLGLTGRQAFALVFAEHGPTTLAAFIAGAALGAGLFLLLSPSLGLASLVGSSVEVPVSVDPGMLLLLLCVLIVVVAVGLVLGATLQRRLEPGAALRGRFE